MQSAAKEAPETLHYSVGILSIAAGSLLLAINYYSTASAIFLIPSTALGSLLLIIAALLAYAGIRKSQENFSLFVSLCLTISALWCSFGVIHILLGQGVLNNATDLHNAMVPGLAAFTLGLLIIAAIGILEKEAILSIIAFSISLSTAHTIAMFYNRSFGSSAVACNFLIVCTVSAYFGVARLLSFLSKKHIILPGTDLSRHKVKDQAQVKGTGKNDFIVIGLILNMVSASVFGCKLLGVTNNLFVGQVPWLWAAGIYQTGVCILSYRCFDMLMATFFGFTSILRFAEGYSLLLQIWQSAEPVFPVPFLVVFAILFFILAMFLTCRSLSEGLYLLFFVAYCIAVACHPSGFFHGGSQGINVAIFVVSAFMVLVYLYNNKALSKIPTGKDLVKNLLSHTSFLKLREEKDLQAPFLGYSKYADAEVLGHACNVLAAFAITMTGDSNAPLTAVILPWVVIAGGLFQLICGSVAFSRGKTLESSVNILYGMMWTIWGFTRYGGLYDSTRGFNVAVGIICFILFNCFIVFCTLFLNKAWFVYSLTFKLILISFLLDAVNVLPVGYDIAASIIFGLVSFYCFLSALFNSTFESCQLPVGTPLVQLSGFAGGNSKCPHLQSRRATSVKKIAELMMDGGTCGVPTDTVYVLVAACNRPDAVEKAYKTKLQAEERPMSLWISSLKQLEPAKHLFSPLLWDFMQEAWPSSISLVIPRGEWLDCFGLKDSAKYIGTPQSIAIRIPDCTVTTHLIDLVGPIAVTSANPSGEADTTHHNQVYAKLGRKVDGVLCDGPSPENIASTVVDCTKIESGNVGFFRVGIVPKSQVLQLLEKVQQKHKSGHVNSAFTDGAREQEEASYLSSTSPDQIHTKDIDQNPPKSYLNGGFSMSDEECEKH